MAHARPARVEQQDRRDRGRRLLLDRQHEPREHLRERYAGGHHLQDAALGLAQRAGLHLVGHVAAGADQARDASRGVLRDLAHALQVPHRAVGAHDPLRVGEAPAPLEGGLDLALDARAIVGVHAGEEALEGDLARLRLEPVDAVELVRPGHGAGREVPLPAADVRDLLRRGQLPLDPPDAFFAPPARRAGLPAAFVPQHRSNLGADPTTDGGGVSRADDRLTRASRRQRRRGEDAQLVAPGVERPAHEAPRAHPSRSAGRPFRSAGHPLRSAERPSRSAGHPLCSAERPSRSAGHPLRSAERPSRSAGHPLRSAERPSRSAGHPFRGEARARRGGGGP